MPPSNLRRMSRARAQDAYPTPRKPMLTLLESLGKILGTSWKTREVAERHSRTFKCRCGNQVFFGNSLCLNCKSPLGYDPLIAQVLSLEAGPRAGTWRAGKS